ncbi:MAG: hypothetical protein ABR884_01430 [Minisyncoccia bacterium]|jgi:hypothetical protein
MDKPEKMGWPAPEEQPQKTAANPRELAIAIIEWIASGFIGALFAAFDHGYDNSPIWLSLIVFVAVSYLVHLSLKELAKKYK